MVARCFFGAFLVLGTFLVVGLALVGCQPAPQEEELTDPATTDPATTDPATTDPATVAEEIDSGGEDASSAGDETLVVFLGDSLTAGFGLDTEQAFPALVEAQLRDAGYAVRTVNAGVSGDTTAGGLRRLDWLLRQDPDVLVVALGGNDGLRGVELTSSEENLRQILQKAQDAEVQVLLAGMLIPPNYGADYTEGFAALYPRLAKEFGVPLIPFLLEGVAAQPELNLPDEIHPTAEGQEIVAETVRKHLESLLEADET